MSSDEKFLERMAEPEYLRKLRQQLDRIKAENDRCQEELWHKLEANKIRQTIRAWGEEPVA